MSTCNSIRILSICAGLLTLGACVSNPRPYDGTLGYQTEQQAEGWLVTYADEYHRSRQAMLENISQVCAQLGDKSVAPPELTLRNERVLIKTVKVPLVVAEGTHTTGSPNLGPPSHWAPVQPTTTQQTITRSIEVREITALCP